jgi:two-component system LytT family response regulator
MNAPLRILVVDDEPLARGKLLRLLADEDGVEVSGEASSFAEAASAIRSLRPELLLLDVQLPDRSGFELLDEVAVELRPEVIFVTAHDEHAVRAFAVRAVDYLVKPYDRERLRVALDRGREQAMRRRREARTLAGDPSAAGGESEPMTRFVVRGVGRLLLIEVGEVDWIEAAGNYVRLHHGRESHLLRETMSSLEARLSPRRFARIHRSTIVNLARVRELHHILHGDYSVLLRDGARLTLSRGYRERFERLIAGAADLRVSG